MDDCRLIMQTLEGETLYARRITLPVESSEDMTDQVLNVLSHVSQVVLSYQKSQEKGTTFEHEYGVLGKKIDALALSYEAEDKKNSR